MAEINTAFVQQIFHTSKRKWITHIHHNRQADDFGRRLEVLEWVAFCHSQMLRNRPTLFKSISSDSAIKTYEKDVTSAEHQYEIELQQREQSMKTLQEQYTSALANYDAQAAIVKSFRAELWDRARVCTRCGTLYLAPRVILG